MRASRTGHKTGNEILQINPSDGEAEDMMKRASVAVAMNKGKWRDQQTSGNN